MSRGTVSEVETGALGPGRIEPRELEQEMRSSFLDYAMSVIVSRALPDVRDGLKPVHRRVLYGMHEAGLQPNRPYKKSAATVGDGDGELPPARRLGDLRHARPHGAAVLAALPARRRAGQLRLDRRRPGGGDAVHRGAPRRGIATELLRDIDANTVDFEPNYDESRRQPSVLPSRFPNLLVNGSTGIAVGMATNMPPHHLGETIDAVVAMIDDPEINVEGPDEAHQGAGLPDRRDRRRPQRDPRRLPHRPRPGRHARARPHRGAARRKVGRSSSRSCRTASRRAGTPA